MAALYSKLSLIPFTVIVLVLITHGAGQTFTQQDYESKSHHALLQGIREFSIEETQLLSDLQPTWDLPLDEITNLKQCSCKSYTCGCCVHAKVKQIGLDADVCLDISYLPSEIGIQVQLTVDKKVIFKKKVSVKNPPPICAGVPGLKKMASVCIRFSDLSLSGKQLSGCVDLEARLFKKVVEKIKIGCFKVPPKFEALGSEYLLVDSDNGYPMEDITLPNEIQEKDQLVEETNPNLSGSNCSCQKDSCLCCAHIRGDGFILTADAEVCLKASLLPKGVGFLAEVTVNGNTILKKEVTTQNPPPICATFSMQVAACLDLKNLHLAEKKVESCADVDFKQSGQSVGKVDLGCFKIPPKANEISSENSLSEADTDSQIEQVALPLHLKQIHKFTFELSQESSGKSCTCRQDSCQCCARLKVGKLHLSGQACFIASFLPKELGIQAEITFNGKSLFKKKVTAQNPPPLCGTLTKSTKMCLVLTNLHIAQKKLEGCAEVAVKMGSITVGKVKLGCFKIPPNTEFDHRLEVLKQLAPDLVKTLMNGVFGDEETVMPLNSVDDSLQKPKCQSGTDSYSCCVDFPAFGKKRSVCLKVGFLPNTLGVDLQVLFDGKVIFHQEIKVNDPPPICVPLPFEKSASVCLKLKNLQLHKDSVYGCIELDAKIKNFTVKKFNLGCFQIPPKAEPQDFIGVADEHLN